MSLKKFYRSINSDDPTPNDPVAWLKDFTDKLANPCSLPDSFPSSTTLSVSKFDFFPCLINICIERSQRLYSRGKCARYSFVINLNHKAKLYLLNIINTCFTTEIVTQPWKLQIIVILKPGKNPVKLYTYIPIASKLDCNGLWKAEKFSNPFNSAVEKI